MAFSIPDKGEAVHELQSVLFQEYIDILQAGIAGTEHVISGCAVSVSSGMQLSVASGKVRTAGLAKTVSSGNVTISTADTTYPRLDFVHVNSSGTIGVRTGTPATNPKPPTKASTEVVLAVVYVPAGLSTVTANHIVDLRVMRNGSKQSIPLLVTALTPRKETAKGCAPLAFITGAASQPDIPYLAFDPNTPEYAGVVIPMPKGWDEGTLTAAFQWRRASGTAAANVVWGIRATAVADNGSPAVNFGSEATVIDAASTTTANFNLSDDTAACTVGNSPTEQGLVFLEVFRKADDATNDTLTVDAWLTSVRVTYTTDTDSDA